jgi:hypothetical protein
MLRSTSDIRISTLRGALGLWLAAESIRERPASIAAPVQVLIRSRAEPGGVALPHGG